MSISHTLSVLVNNFFKSFLEEIESNITVVKNYQKLKELQKNLVWPSVSELDPKSYIPEVHLLVLLR